MILRNTMKEWGSEKERRGSPKWVYEVSRLWLEQLELNPVGCLRKNVQRTPQFACLKNKEVEVFTYQLPSLII